MAIPFHDGALRAALEHDTVLWMRILRTALLLAGWSCAAVLACADAAPGGGAGQVAPPAEPPPPRFWLVNTEVAPAPGQPPARTVRGPVLVELLPGGKVRSLPESAEAFEGFVPESTWKTPADRRGLMLYGQRVSDLHLDSPAGPVIGRIHPGAFVSVAPHDDATWLVAVSRYRSPPPSSEGKPLLAYVEKGALGPAPREQVPPSLPGEVVRDFTGLPLWGEGTSRVLVEQLLCGEFHVTDDHGRVRAAQYHDGIEVSGLFDVSWPWVWGDRGENGCGLGKVYRRGTELREQRGKDWLDSAVVESVPEGYRMIDLPAADPFEAVLRGHRSVFWLVQTPRGLECHEWKATRATPRKGTPGAAAEIEGEIRRQRDPHEASFKLHYTPSPGGAEPGVFSLWGPSLKEGDHRCVRAFVLVGTGPGLLHVEHPPIHPTGWPEGWTLFAYRPEDVEHWFLGREACESARERASEAIARDPAAADHLGVHLDCYRELSE